jgi:hypothetical protein
MIAVAGLADLVDEGRSAQSVLAPEETPDADLAGGEA